MIEKPRPECEKLCEVAPFSQKIGEFLDWVQEEHGAVLANYDRVDRLQTLYISKTDLLAQFFGIDMNLVEKERHELLEDLRAAHNPDNGQPE